MRRIAPLLLAVLAASAWAGGDSSCNGAIEAALRAAAGRHKGALAASDCRPWPAAPGRVAAAVMAFEKPGPGTHGDQAWDVVIALVDPTQEQALSSHRATVDADATTYVGRSSLRLDLAPYLIRPGVRALGLRFSSDRGNSLANSRSGTPLRLYVAEGRRLRPVFCQAMGWQDAGLGVIGQDAWDEASTTVSVSQGKTRGWQDLRLTDQLSHYTPDFEGSKPVASHRACRFEGSAYRCEPPASQAITSCDPAGL